MNLVKSGGVQFVDLCRAILREMFREWPRCKNARQPKRLSGG